MRAELQQQQQAAPAAPQQQTRPAPDARTELRDQIREAVRAAQEGVREGVSDGRATRDGLRTGDEFAARVRIAQEALQAREQAPPASAAPPARGRIVVGGEAIDLPQGMPRVTVDDEGRMTVVGSDGRTTIREPDGRVVMIAADGSMSQASGVPSAREFIAPVNIDDAVIVPAMFFLTILLSLIGYPIARAIARRMDRKTVAAPAMKSAALPLEAASRLARIEQSVDAIAIEVERISEGQRFTTRLMSEMRSTANLPSHHAPAAVQSPQLPPASLDETSFAQRAMARPDRVAAPSPDAPPGTGGGRGK